MFILINQSETAIVHIYKGNRVHKPLEALVDNENYVVLGGGAYTIPKLLKEKGFDTFVLQGGFAGANVIENPLKKFEGKKICPSWNPNLDVKATKYMIDNCDNLTFISKDICHDSWVQMEDLDTYGDTVTFIKKYLLSCGSRKKKLMHDLVALLYIVDSNLAETTRVKMIQIGNKWGSTHNPKSSTKISIGWDKKLFIEMLNSVG